MVVDVGFERGVGDDGDDEAEEVEVYVAVGGVLVWGEQRRKSLDPVGEVYGCWSVISVLLGWHSRFDLYGDEADRGVIMIYVDSGQ